MVNSAKYEDINYSCIWTFFFACAVNLKFWITLHDLVIDFDFYEI